MTLYIDFDGTLHESNRVFAPALRSVYSELVAKGLAEPRELSNDTIAGFIGAPSAQTWNFLVPDMSAELVEEKIREVGRLMEKLLAEGAGRLFRGTEASLDMLKETGHDLIIVSNCTADYMLKNRGVYGLDRWFSDYVLIGNYPDCKSKSEMLEAYLKSAANFENSHTNSLSAAVVGDRSHDMAAARHLGFPFIGCAYGYAPKGELDGADAIINDIRKLPETVEKLLTGP